nr:putative uncharacterized protein DDB_G0289263 [Hydra vulgaris]
MNANIDDLLMRCSLNKLIKIVEFQKDVLTQQTHYKNILNRYEALFISVINEEKRKNTNVNSHVTTRNSGLDRILLNSFKNKEENKFCSDKIRYSNENLNKEELVKEDLSFKITKSCFNKQDFNRPCNMFKESMVQLWERIHYDFSYKRFLDNNFPKRSLSLDSESNLSKKTFYESNFLDHDFSESCISEHSIFNRCFEYDLNVVIDITESFLSDSEIKKNTFSRDSAIDDNVTPENFNQDNNVTPENINQDNNVTPENFNHDDLNILHVNFSDNQSNNQGNKYNTFDKNVINDKKVPFTKLSNDKLENYNNRANLENNDRLENYKNRANLENNRKVIKSVLKYFPQSKDNLFGEINPHYSPFWSVIPKNT